MRICLLLNQCSNKSENSKDCPLPKKLATKVPFLFPVPLAHPLFSRGGGGHSVSTPSL